jgi:outer membrane protein assembly factor BamB
LRKGGFYACVREHLTKKRHARWALIGALFLALTACSSQTTSGTGRATPSTDPTLAPWVPTLTPTNVPYSTAVPGTMPHVGGLLYVATFDGSVLAINPATGATKWSVSAGTSVGLVATDHAVYIVGDGKVSALRLSDGAQLWSAAGEYPRADADGVLYADKNEGIVAINDLTGTTRWTWTPPTEEESASNLVFGPGVVLVATTVRGGGGGSGYYGLYAVDTRTGAQRWKRPWGDRIYGAPFIAGDRALFCHWSSSSGKLGAYTLTTGATVWERDFAGFNARDGEDIRSTDTQRIYLGIGEAGLAALRASDGATIWSHDPLTSSESELYPFAFTATGVYAWVGAVLAKFDATSGTQTWSQQVGGGRPVLLDNMIYLSRGSPDVTYALDVTTGALYWKRDLPSSVASGPFPEP